MKETQKMKGRAMTVPGGLAAGAVVALTITLLGSLGIAQLLNKKILPMEKSGYGVMALLFLASGASGLISAKKIKHQRLAVIFLAGLIYFGMLLSITAMFFGGQYEGAGEAGIMVFFGSAFAVLAESLSLKGKKKRRK